MYTRDPGSTPWRRFLPPLLATILSIILLGAWMHVVSAQKANPADQAIESNFPDQIRESTGQNAQIGPAHQITNTENLVLEPNAVYDLAITKSKIPTTFTVGTNNRYIINVSRTNTETVSEAVIVEDDLPTGMSWTPPSTAGKWDCTTSTATNVSCVYNDVIPSVNFEPINIIVNVSPNIAPMVTNIAKLTNGGSNTGNDSYSLDTPIRSADLVIKKIQEPTPVTSTSDVITYTIVITNNGPTIAKWVTVTDTLPAELNNFTLVSKTIGDFDPITFRWNNFDLNKGSVEKLVVTTTPKSDSNGKQVVNTARVTSVTYDYDLSNNTDSESFVIGGLEIGKRVSKTTAFTGELFYYTIVVTNTSSLGDPITAYVNDTFSDTLDIDSCQVRYESVLSNQPTGETGICYFSGQDMTTFVSIPGKQRALVTVNVRGNKNIGFFPKTVKNIANVTWSNQTYLLESNEVEITINPAAFIEISKSDNRTSVNRGQSISYTISITNVGSLDIQSGSLVVTDTLVNNLTFVSLTKNGLNIDEPTKELYYRVWKFPTQALAAGQKITFFITAKVSSNPSGTETYNYIEAAAIRQPDGRETKNHNEDRSTITAIPSTQIDIDKSVTPAQAQVGETFTFKIVLRNTGAEAANNIRVNDYFPDALDLSSATTSRGTAQLSTTTREVEVNITTMNPDEQTTIVITAKVNSTVKTQKTYRNLAYIKWTGVGEFSSNAAAYRVLPSGTLPGTGGFGPLSSSIGPAVISGSLGLMLFVASLVLLAFYLWARRNRPLSAARYARGGLMALGLALICWFIAVFALPKEESATKLSMLSGEKPPVATSLPVLPASTNPPAGNKGENPKEPNQAADETLEPVELLDLRPTPDASQLTADANLTTPTLTNGEIDISHLLPTATPSVLPEYAIPTPTSMPSVGPDGGEPDSSAMNRITIPSIGVNAVVKYVPFNGSTWLISGLKQEVAWMGDTSWPGLGGNTGLAGHVDLATGEKGPFWNLRNLRNGDQVIVYTEKKIYSYRVNSQKIVDDTDLSVIGPTTKPQLTLITCTGWDTNVRLYLKRLVIFAELVDIKPLTAFSN